MVSVSGSGPHATCGGGGGGGPDLTAHPARAPSPDPRVNIKGETLVELYDDAYYFWHPGTETFLADGTGYIIGTPTAARHWDVRKGLISGNPNSYYMFWSQELHDKRKWVLDLLGNNLSSGARIGTYPKNEGDNQKWVLLRSNGDKDG